MESSMEQNLSLYHIFNTVAEAGNISHAAKELYISQPAISKAVTTPCSGRRACSIPIQPTSK